MAAGGADQPGVLWAGTLPGGLFRSNDRGDSWELVRSLWDVPQRAEWFGGGYDVPASASTRATAGACWSGCRAAACGRPVMAAPPGKSPRPACAPVGAALAVTRTLLMASTSGGV
jgi:hypothetical protein